MNKPELTKVLHKEYHKQFKPAMELHSFKRYKTNDYLRVTPDHIAQLINIQKHSWDLSFTFNITIFPLYFPSDFMYFAFGGPRIGYFKKRSDFWWRYDTITELKKSLDDVEQLFYNKIFSYYDNIGDSQKLVSYLNSKSCALEPSRYPDQVGLLYMYLGDSTNAKKYLDAEQLKKIDAFVNPSEYFRKVVEENYKQFGIDPEKYTIA